MTTLELAQAIAKAVRDAMLPGGNEPTGDAPVQAIFKTLDDHDSWFCRISEDEHGCTVETPYEPVQLKLNFDRKTRRRR